jgi:hypothetical protein
MTLVDEIARAKTKALNDGDAKMAAEVATKLPTQQVELGDDVRLRLQLFAQWCERHSVRACPSRPTTIAQWVLEHGHLGADSAMATLAAVEAIHAHHGLANPVKTPIVSKALEQHFQSDAPRSWKTDERLLFATLPEAIKQIIARRERDRERELRSCQNRAAAAERELKQKTEAADSVITTEKEVSTNV